ncbi:MAG: DNA polymerase III subunit alpha [Bacteroidia bacterium]|nr:DNA polymerase III subunit alpha [Bacteroidia bacterium]
MYLNCHSYYSLKYGTMSVEDLVEAASKKGITSFVLTDINNSGGMVDLIKACREKNIKPVAGIEFRIGSKYLYTGIAKNNKGFEQLNNFLSEHNIKHLALPKQPELLSDAIWVYRFGQKQFSELRENEFIGIRISDINLFLTSGWENYIEKILILQPVTFETAQDYETHTHLRAIAENTLISMLDKDEFAKEDEHFFSPEEIDEKFMLYPSIIENTKQFLSSCSFDLTLEGSKNKKTFTGSHAGDKTELARLANAGMLKRYGSENETAKKRIAHELKVIDDLKFSAYFLITQDIIRYSMSQGFYHVGRGSGANSIVAYCLNITDVDPIELDLYFERFLNPKRSSPPDFDIDYSWKDRDAVIDYIFSKYGNGHVALLGNINTFKDRSIIRELGKVFGLPKEEIDNLIRDPKVPEEGSLAEKIYRIGSRLSAAPNHRSIHAGGILISEKPLSAYTALDMPPKGYPTVQWDMYIASDIGFEKLDILSQRGIGHINDAVHLVYKTKGVILDIHNVAMLKSDENVCLQLESGNTIGCFYVESPAMRGLLKKLRCKDYLTLVAASSIIRPGVASSGMMREYILRFHNPGSVKYLHPIMEEQLKETFGVMVYQEDVIKVCHHFAGLDLADADVLRRAMSGKHRGRKEFDDIRDRFFSNCTERGYSDELSNEVWRQVESFASYSFSKAHSASYAVESYQSMYLKTYYPLEFMVAVINNFGGFYSTWVYVNEARKAGGVIHVPDVNLSDHLTNIYEDDIYLGFIHVSTLEQKLAQLIPFERLKNGNYTSLQNFVERTGVGLEQLLLLVRVGAFSAFNKGKKELLWDAYMLKGNTVKEALVLASPLFPLPATTDNERMPELYHDVIDDVYDELELLGFAVSQTMFDMLQTGFRGDSTTENLIKLVGKSIRIVGQYVTYKPVRAKNNKHMAFGTFIDVESNFFDTTHFPSQLAAYPFKGAGMYLIKGKVVEEFGFPSIEVEKMAKLQLKLKK